MATVERTAELTGRRLSGWMSRFHVAVKTCRRIVLHGNVMDLVYDENSQAAVSLTEWLCGRLRGEGFQRIVYYDHVHAPTALEWERMPHPLPASRDVARDLEALERILQEEPPPASTDAHENGAAPGPLRAALILANPDHLIGSPSLEFGLLFGMSGRGERGVGRNLIIHLVTRESAIPPDFVTADPDTAVILVPTPSFSQRLYYFSRLPAETPLRLISEDDQLVEPERLARVTEGYRLRELTQLVELAEAEGTEGGLGSFLSLYRFGRRYDHWADLRVERVEAKLAQIVLGQDQAISQIKDSLFRAKQRVDRLIDDGGRHPAMVLFFVGATGVGKTLMARTLCEAVTGTQENLKIFDMSEFQREHHDQRLIGSPPGYVGFDEGGQLTNWVQERPHSMVLFDEVEKAHERILDLFLQILDGARLTSGKGVTVDFSDTIVVFTSNIGAGRDDQEIADLDKRERDSVVDYFHRRVEEFFSDDIERPELFNRLRKGVVVFNFMSEPVARQAVQRKLQSLVVGMQARLPEPVRIDFDPQRDHEVVDQLLKRVRFEEYGLRDVDTAILQLAGAGVGKLLDSMPSQGRYRLRWDDGHRKIAIAIEGGA